MSEKSTPAGSTGGDTTAATTAALADLPARIRIHALAKLLGRNSREVLAAVAEAGVTGRSVQSSIDREVALKVAESFGVTPAEAEPAAGQQAEASAQQSRQVPPTPVFASAAPLFRPPEPAAAPPPPPQPQPRRTEPEETEEEDRSDAGTDADEDNDEDSRPRRRRGRRGRGRGKGGQGEDGADGDERSEDDRPAKADKDDKPSDKQEKSDKPDRRRGRGKPDESDADDDESDESDAASRRRRRRRRRKGGTDDEGGPTEDDPPNTVVHVREARDKDADKPESDGRDEVRSVRGSTRLEAKRQRRRDGREAGRRRAPILSEAEFLARREAVDRAMVVRERGDRIQIGVLEDGVLVEHFVTSAGTGSLVGNVYLGRVQNVLPSMEAAFVDIGRGRNAVLYAGEVDWDAAGLEGKARKIEQALSTGDSVLVQVTKDPVGHKGARLTTQISLPGRFLVYVPGGGATGISRKLPENERRRLKDVLKRVVPEDAGVIIRTASEGISEEELGRDVRRLQAQWQVIQDKTKGTNGTRKVSAPALVYEEPDLLVKVVRDLFTEDFSALVIEGEGAWETVDAYVRHVAPELADRVRRHVGTNDVFAEYRIEEQLLKALDRKVWLPSGGYLVIDRTEAMTVIDVNTGKFTGSGGNLEETVTRNNLESAEEIVRQLRLRDIGGIIVIDFIDMVLESNRDLVLRRLTECLGRDRTRHQVAEVTSLGLVQMTRKRVGTGLLEAFGTTCEHCKGRGVLVSTEPMGKPAGNGSGGQQGGGRRSRGRGEDKEAKESAKDAAAKEAAKGAAKAVRDIAKASNKANGEPQADGEAAAVEPAELTGEPAVDADAAGEPEHAGRTRRRSRRRAGEPSATIEPVAEPAVSTVPAGTESFIRSGEYNGVPEQANGRGHDDGGVTTEPVPEDTAEPLAGKAAEDTAEPAETVEDHADAAGPDVAEPPVTAVTAPPRRPVRRGASRPAGPPVPATHDG